MNEKAHCRENCRYCYGLIRVGSKSNICPRRYLTCSILSTRVDDNIPLVDMSHFRTCIIVKNIHIENGASVL